MADEAIGGFYVSLKTLVDEGSFRRGISNISGMATGLGDLLKAGAGLLGIGASLKEILKAAGEQGQMLMTAKYANMSADALETWTSVVAETGKTADGFVTSLEALNDAFIEMGKMGEAGNTSQLFKDLDLLGVKNIKGELAANSDQRAKDILNAAMVSKDQGMADIIVKRLLGQSGLDILLLTQSIPGMTINKMYDQAAGRAIRNPARQGGLEGVVDVRIIQTQFNQLFGRFSSKVMEDLKPTLEGLLGWLDTNKDTLTNLVDGLAKLTTAILSFSLSGIGSLITDKPGADLYKEGGKNPFVRGLQDKLAEIGKVLHFKVTPIEQVMKDHKLSVDFHADVPGKATIKFSSFSMNEHIMEATSRMLQHGG